MIMVRHGIGAPFPLTVLLVSVSVPELLIPPPNGALDGAWPLRMVNFETVTWAVVLEILTTVLEALPSTVAADPAPEPIMSTATVC